MPNHFVESLLAKADPLSLSKAYEGDKPGTELLVKLIDDLARQQSFDSLQTLQDVLAGANPDDKLEMLIAKISIHLLPLNLEQNDSELLKASLEKITAAPALWPQCLLVLSRWIKSAERKTPLTGLLSALSASQCEMLYAALTDSLEQETPWSLELFEYIDEKKAGSDDEFKAHLQRLGICLLLSPTEWPVQRLNNLALLLEDEQLVEVILKLPAIASTYAREQQEVLRFTASRQNYLAKYDNLINVLTVRASASESAYQKIVANRPYLANRLMQTSLKSCTEKTLQEKLVAEALSHYQVFDWNDSQFTGEILPAMIAVCADKTGNSRELFRQFFQREKLNVGFFIRFLSELYKKTTDIDLLMLFLKEINQTVPDHSFTINFLTQNFNQSSQLTENLLNLLGVEQLITICSHVLALQQIFQQEESLCKQYCRILSEKLKSSISPAMDCANIARNIFFLPEEFRAQPLELITSNLSGHSKLSFEWFRALSAHSLDKSLFFPHFLSLLRSLPANEQQLLLDQLNQDEFYGFYIYFLDNQNREEKFNFLSEYLKHKEKHSYFEYLLLLTPQVHQKILDTVLPVLEPVHLIELIAKLIEKSQQDSSYLAPLHQLLMQLCLRMQTTLEENAAIHQWTKYPAIAEYLFSTPRCLHSLCSRSSLLQNITPSMLQGMLITAIESDLRLRAVRVLNTIEYRPDEMDEKALRLLHFHKGQPAVLQQIFKSLYKVENSLDDRGKKNFNALKHSCWKLLHTGQYAETECQTFLCFQLKHSTALEDLSVKLGKEQRSILSPDYLSQIDNKLLNDIADTALIKILFQSLEPTTLGNWDKVRNAVDQRKTPQSFIQQLIIQLKQQAENPVLDKHVFQFITQLQHFKKTLATLPQEDLFWILKAGRSDYIVQHFSGWLKQLIKTGRLDHLNRAALFSLLPKEQAFLRSIYSLPELRPYLQPLFIEFAQQPLALIHYTTLFEQLKLHRPEEREQVLSEAHRLIKPELVNLEVIPVINRMLMDLTLNPEQESHRVLVFNQIDFFTKLAGNSAVHKRNHIQFVQEFQQTTFNSMAVLQQQNSAWSPLILASNEFAKAIDIWLRDLSKADIEHHPFINMLLNHFDIILHQPFMETECCQQFLQLLLLMPPARMTEEQYALLFHKLCSDRQKLLAVEVLQRSKLEDVQWSSLITLAKVLSVQTLYEIFLHSQTLFVFVDLIARHPEGIHSLAPEQIDALLAELTSAGQLYRILSSQTPNQIKFNFVQTLFDYLQRQNRPLSDWLDKINADEQALAVLANYTTRPAEQEQLHQLLMGSPSRRQQVQHFLLNPDLEIRIEDNGLLQHYVRSAWLSPWQGWRSHPLLLNCLTFSDALPALQVKVAQLQEVLKLNEFYEPLGNRKSIAENNIVSARWLQRLPLIEGVLLELIGEANTPSSVWVDSALFKSVIQPLLQQEKRGVFEPLVNDLPNMIKALLDPAPAQLDAPKGACLEKLRLEKMKTIQEAWQQFKLHLTAIEYYTSPRLHALFNPDSYFARLKAKRIALLPKAESEALAKAQTLHKEWQEKNQFSIRIQFNELLSGFFKLPGFLQRIEVQEWLLGNCLFTPLGLNIAPELLHKILSTVSPAMLIAHLKQDESCEHIDTLAKLNKLLKKYPTTEEFVQALYALDGEQLASLLSCSYFYQLNYTSRLLSMVQKARAANISDDILYLLILPESLGQQLELQWLHTEIQHLPIFREQLNNHCRMIAAEALKSRQNKYDRLRLASLKDHSALLNGLELGSIFNSYLPIFNPPNPATIKEFLLTLSDLLDSQKTPELINSLNEVLLDAAIKAACSAPVVHYKFLNRLLQDPNLSAVCARQIRSYLQQQLAGYFPGADPLPVSLAELHASQFQKLEEEQVSSLTALQKLLFSIEPVAELRPWLSELPFEEKNNAAHFCAIASLQACLNRWYEQAGTPPDAQLQDKLFLAADLAGPPEESLQQSMAALSATAYLKYPAVYFHYLLWIYYWGKCPEDLVESLTKWLFHFNPDEMEQSLWLEKSLELLINAGLTEELCKQLHAIPELQRLWILTKIVQTTPITNNIFASIAPLISWDWLRQQAQKKTLASCDWLKIALQEESILQSILQDEHSITAFLQLLLDSQLPAGNIIEAYKTIANSRLKTLLLSHLLSRPDYLQQLPGKSLLNALLSNSQEYVPLRLKSLLHPLAPGSLSESILQFFQADAAAELICSLKHFNQFSPGLLKQLLARVGEQSEPLIIYWLNHYATLPGAQAVLVMLQEVVLDFFSLVSKLNDQTRQKIIRTILEARFKYGLQRIDNLEGLASCCDESHIDYCIHLYMHREKEEPALIQLICEMIQNLYQRVGVFSNQSMQLLLRLYEDPHFESLRESIEEITKRYRYNNALFSDCSILYDDGQINTKRMQESVSLKAQTGTRPLWQIGDLSSSDDSKDSQPSPIWENYSLLNEIARNEDSISFLSYFLIHYHGEPEALQNCLEEYLATAFSDQQKFLEQISWLLTRAELSQTTGQTLFNCFLNHPHLLNNTMKLHLLCFNAEKFLQTMGMQKNYEDLIHFCETIEPLATNYPAVLPHVERAKQEAQFESRAMEMSGWLLALRLWFKRSFFYGWETWLTPRTPRYVLPFHQGVDSSLWSYSKMQPLGDSSSLPKELGLLLRHVEHDFSPRALNALYEALRQFEWQPPPVNMLQLREQIDKVSQLIHKEALKDRKIERWLAKHQELLVNNRHQLLSLYFQKGKMAEIQSLLAQENESGPFAPLARELKPTAEIAETEIPVPTKSKEPPEKKSSPVRWASFRNYLLSSTSSSTRRKIEAPPAFTGPDLT